MFRAISRVTLLVALLALEAPARAQDEDGQPRHPQSMTPSQMHERATEAFDRGEFDLALGLFELLVELTGSNVERFNAAACLEELGRWTEAYRGYREVSDDPRTDATYRGMAEEAIGRVRARVAIVELRGPDGALARVDGAEGCRVPCELPVDPGEHQLAIEEPFADTRELAARAGRTHTVTFRPPPPGPSLGWLTPTGAGLAALGLAGILGFGLTTDALLAEFQRAPSVSLSREGSLMRDLTNASIAVAAAGGVLVLIDIVLFATHSPAREPDARAPSARNQLR